LFIYKFIFTNLKRNISTKFKEMNRYLL